MDTIFAELISLPRAEHETGIKGATLRRWVRVGLVAGVPRKPFRIHRPSLISFLTDRSNPAFKELCSKGEKSRCAA